MSKITFRCNTPREIPVVIYLSDVSTTTIGAGWDPDHSLFPERFIGGADVRSLNTSSRMGYVTITVAGSGIRVRDALKIATRTAADLWRLECKTVDADLAEMWNGNRIERLPLALQLPNGDELADPGWKLPDGCWQLMESETASLHLSWLQDARPESGVGVRLRYLAAGNPCGFLQARVLANFGVEDVIRSMTRAAIGLWPPLQPGTQPGHLFATL